MRYVLLSLSLLPFAACGDDAAAGGDGADVIGGDTDVLFDTNPDKDLGNDPGGGGNRPPELERIGDRTVAVGQTLKITLVGKDPDGDALTYSVFGNLPPGARFDKAEHRFEWAPTESGKTVFLTFVVSDGTDFDRETVRIEVTDTAEAHPPSFADVGDQTLRVGEPYTLTLVATDPDGDRLSYGHEGALPSGASLDSTSGVFSWRPQASDVGNPVRITFTVSDGTASDSMTVRFVVDDGGTTVNKPPVFTPIPPQTVRAGETLTVNLQASDPDGDPITFSIQGAAPPGGSLNGATFTYTPQQSAVGQTIEVKFAASDGNFTAVASVKISVTSGQVASCTPDAQEPNEDIAHATPQGVGSRTATICESAGSYDIDVYAIQVPAGQSLGAKITFDGNQGDLDILLTDAAGGELAVSDGVTSVEQLSWFSQSGATVYLFVYGYGLEALSVTYTLEVTLEASAVCVNDGYEPNNTPAQAKPLSAQVEDATLQICANDDDYWTLSVGCGARVEVIMDILDQADLDLALYDDATGSQEPVAIAITEDPSEYIDVPMATRPGTWLLQVSGYPAASAESRYQLVYDVTGACQDDGQAGSSRQSATTLSSSAGELSLLKICCGSDWFGFPLTAGAQVVLDLGVVSGSLGAVIYGSDGTTQIASKEPSPNGGLVFFSASGAGTYYLKLSGSVGTAYGFGWDVQSASAGCTNMSCEKFDVCDDVSGDCVLDYCFEDLDCPNGYLCRETYCVNPCVNDQGCRPGYACKLFDDNPVARYCGVVGPGTVGAGCEAHADCAGAMACLFDNAGGYCAGLDCGSCQAGSKCATVGGLAFCAKSCDTNADCREADGYTCSSEKTCLPQNP